MKQNYTEDQIANAPEWMAIKMVRFNEAGYFMGAARQFMYLGQAWVVLSFILIFSNRLVWSIAASSIGMVTSLVAKRYLDKARRVLDTL